MPSESSEAQTPARAQIWIEISTPRAPLEGGRVVNNIWRMVLYPTYGSLVLLSLGGGIG